MAQATRKTATRTRSAIAGAEARICAAVRTAILERRLAPGTRMREIPLGAFFGVSRTIVRQALRRLAHEGLVALRERRVAVVARPSARDVAHVFAARRAIEGAVVEATVARITRAGIAALRSVVRDEEAAYRRGDRQAGLRLSLEFHRSLGELCGNPVLARYLAELVLQSSLAVALYERPDRVHAHAEHVGLLDAIAARDARRARRLMAEHLALLERDLAVSAPVASPSLAAIFGAASAAKHAGNGAKRPAGAAKRPVGGGAAREGKRPAGNQRPAGHARRAAVSAAVRARSR